MSELITKIKKSVPTHTGEEAQSILRSVFTSSNYVIFPATIYGIKETEDIANLFLNVYAEAVTLSNESIKIYNPIYIASASMPNYDSCIFYLLYYHNGHILYLEDIADSSIPEELVVFIDKDIIKSLNLPYQMTSVSSFMDFVQAAEDKLKTKDSSS